MVGVNVKVKGVSLHEYDELLVKVIGDEPSDEAIPDAVQAHVAGTSEGDLCVFQVWESKREFQKFWDDFVSPALKKMNVTEEPEISFFQIEEVLMRQEDHVANLLAGLEAVEDDAEEIADNADADEIDSVQVKTADA